MVWPCHSSSGLMMGANEISVQCWPNPQPCAGLEVSEGNNCCCCVGKDKPRVPSISTPMENILLYMCSIVVFVRRQFEQSWGRERGTSEDLLHQRHGPLHASDMGATPCGPNHKQVNGA